MSLSRCPSCEVESTIPSVIADKAFDELIANSEGWERKFVDENKKNESLVKTVEEANARIQQLQSEIAELKKLQEAEDWATFCIKMETLNGWKPRVKAAHVNALL